MVYLGLAIIAAVIIGAVILRKKLGLTGNDYKLGGDVVVPTPVLDPETGEPIIFNPDGTRKQ